MDTARLKRFATEARIKIKQGVTLMIRQWGFDADGNVMEEPQLLQGGTLFRNQVIGDEDVYHRWCALRNKIQQVGLRNVYEEAAYTWFNRFVAIKILSKNELLESYLDYEAADGKPTPIVITQARRGILPEMSDYNRRRVMDLADDHNREAELLTLLITSVCHNTPILANCFGHINDYTELLLPRTITTQGDFLDMLNDVNYITDEDYRQPELIGWLYQFYISERKDEVFASFKSGKKATKDEIPAATQIFTPNWIVKYMVQNTIGRIYLDNNSYSSLKDDWKYLVQPADENTSEENILKVENPEELTIIDAGCGSGHILVEAFDTLYSIYLEQYASPREACDSILQYNIVGVDIDTRAKQLAQFALLMKACSYVPEMADCHVMPRVFDMPEPISVREMENLKDTLPHFFLGGNTKVINETIEAIELLQQAQELGSIMKFNVSEATRYAIKTAMENENASQFSFYPHLKLMQALTEKYSSVVMNPPYMGAGNMNPILSKYVKDNYEEGKADLCTTFMLMQAQRTLDGGLYANIIPPSWMFLSTFEGLRQTIIETKTIKSLLHLSRGIFGADFGSVSCVIQNKKTNNATGTYFRLIERTFQEFDQKHLQILFEKTLANNDFRYYFADYNKEVTDIIYSEHGAKIYYPQIPQQNFAKIPGYQIGYWISKNLIRHFIETKQTGDYFDVKSGLSTGDNSIFVRFWHEINPALMYFKTLNDKNSRNGYKWFPYSKGGGVKKWYGNKELVVNYENDAYEMKKLGLAVFRNPSYYFREGLTWSGMSSSYVSYRYLEAGGIFDSNKGPMIFSKSTKPSLEYALGLLNTKVSNLYTQLLNPTVSTQIGDVVQIPIDYVDSKATFIEKMSKDNVDITKLDWDAHETSWNFKRPELLSINEETYINNINWTVEKHFRESGEHICIDPAAPQFESLEWCFDQYKQKWEQLLFQLHANEEELNRQFIDIYGLQDELTPDVPMEDITILQEGEVKIEDNHIKWNADVVMKQLISYAIGVWMGRYRLDKPGLHIAHPAPSEEEIAAYEYNNLTIEIDDDGIIPILPDDSPFTDNARNRIVDFISTAFGAENQIDNLNFLERALGKSVSDYLIKDFWKDHKKMYQNRPIYWLFSSKKGAFQCITYMHRMDEYTLERIRQKYLLPYISFLDDKISAMQARDTLSTAETRQMTKLKTMLDECREYHDRLHQYSQKNISFDLDDGVVKNYSLFGDVVAKLK